MKKFFAALLTAVLVLSLTASAFAATGLGVITTVSVKAATADAAGSVAVTTTLCALTLDDEGKIAGVVFDVVESKATTDADASAESLSKNELGESYGMKAYAPSGKEYFEQMDALEAWCIGKTVEEVVTGSADNADLKAGCTIYIGDQLKALQEAAANAQ